ncbi:hypothetical protein BDY24DRAFT_261204 [Mrakia frigida]|uniref:uncharacterized protein n=1 Tax=Mrakia frigida TaxID=29902 RepID=UPI003FCC0336
MHISLTYVFFFFLCLTHPRHPSISSLLPEERKKGRGSGVSSAEASRAQLPCFAFLRWPPSDYIPLSNSKNSAEKTTALLPPFSSSNLPSASEQPFNSVPSFPRLAFHPGSFFRLLFFLLEVLVDLGTVNCVGKGTEVRREAPRMLGRWV